MDWILERFQCESMEKSDLGYRIKLYTLVKEIVANRTLHSPLPANCTHHEGLEPPVDTIGIFLYF